MILIYCNLVSTWWQWSVDLRQERDSTKGETTQKIKKTHNTQNRKQKYKKHKKY
jgi:hypothetical protein